VPGIQGSRSGWRVHHDVVLWITEIWMLTTFKLAQLEKECQGIGKNLVLIEGLEDSRR
jgi:hypothetical protein